MRSDLRKDLERLSGRAIAKPPSDGRGTPSAWYGAAARQAPPPLGGREQQIVDAVDATPAVPKEYRAARDAVVTEVQRVLTDRLRRL